MSWTFSVAACRYDGALVRTTSYVVAGDAHGAWTVGGADARGLTETAMRTFRELGKDDAIVEAGRVNGDDYLMVVRRGAVLQVPQNERGWSTSPDAPIVLGPSAALALAEEWSLSPTSIESAVLTLGKANTSPYPPHRSPIGNAPLHAIATDPFRWSRPFAALDADRNAVLSLTASRTIAPPREIAFIESLIPLVAGGDAMEWLASVSGRIVTRIRASVALLIGSVTDATGQPAPALIDDPVAGEHYGYAPPLATRLALRDLVERAA
jgi:hypothetical protein